MLAPEPASLSQQKGPGLDDNERCAASLDTLAATTRETILVPRYSKIAKYGESSLAFLSLAAMPASSLLAHYPGFCIHLKIILRRL